MDQEYTREKLLTTVEELRAKILIGVEELDAGKSGPLDMRKIKAEARRQYGTRP